MIVAIGVALGVKADLVIDDLALEGPVGAAAAVAAETFRRQTQKIRFAPISLVWDRGYRTLENTLKALDEAGLAGADLACLPQECVLGDPQPIPGPTADAIGKKAAEHKMYVVGNLRERDGEKTYVTSFLCDRQGRLAGKYRQSHRLPYEAYPESAFDLGDDLPVFPTEFGPLGQKIGSDHYFAEIDAVLRQRGVRLVVWSTLPFPMRDEHQETLALQGRAVDNGLYYAVAATPAKKATAAIRPPFPGRPVGRWAAPYLVSHRYYTPHTDIHHLVRERAEGP